MFSGTKAVVQRADSESPALLQRLFEKAAPWQRSLCGVYALDRLMRGNVKHLVQAQAIQQIAQQLDVWVRVCVHVFCSNLSRRGSISFSLSPRATVARSLYVAQRRASSCVFVNDIC